MSKRKEIENLLQKNQLSKTNNWREIKNLKDIAFFRLLDGVVILINYEINNLVIRIRQYCENIFIYKKIKVKNECKIKESQQILLKYYKRDNNAKN